MSMWLPGLGGPLERNWDFVLSEVGSGSEQSGWICLLMATGLSETMPSQRSHATGPQCG